MLSRRQAAFLPLAMFMAGCSVLTGSGSSPTTFDQAKSYADDLILALGDASQTYAVSPGASNVNTVLQINNDLMQLKQSLDQTTNPTSARDVVLQVITFAQQLSPLVMPFLGPAGQYVPLAIAVLQSFVQSFPPPPQAPPTPPAQLHAKAMHYRPRHHH